MADDGLTENGAGPPPCCHTVGCQPSTNEEGEYEQFKLQIAGHQFARGKQKDQQVLGVLHQKSSGHIFKPMQIPPRGEREALFYAQVFRKQQSDKDTEPAVTNDSVMAPLAQLIPAYFGTRVIPFDGIGHCYIELEDITRRFVHPCILDVKIGSVTWDPEASAEKVEYERTKYPSGLKLGFRFLGMRVHDPSIGEDKAWDKHWGKKITEDQIFSTLKQFFCDRNPEYVRLLIAKFLDQLHRIQTWFKTQRRYRFYSSSVLFVYEGAADAQTHDVICDAKMIDFTHIFQTEDLDTNYLEGLENFIRHLENYKRQYLVET